MESDSFSLRRLGLLARFYTPVMRLLLIVTGIVLVACYFLSFYGVILESRYSVYEPGELPGSSPFMLMYSTGVGIAGYVYLAGPFIFAIPKKRALMTTLPASWVEKSVFMFLWSFVVYPLFLAAVWYGLTGLCSLWSDKAFINDAMMNMLSQQVNESLQSNDVGPMTSLSFDRLLHNSNFYSGINNMSFVAIIILVISSVRRNRAILGIVGSLACSFAFSIIGIITGIYLLVHSHLLSEIVSGQSSPDYIVQAIIDELAAVYPVEACFAVVVVIVCMVLTFRKIKTCQN